MTSEQPDNQFQSISERFGSLADDLLVEFVERFLETAHLPQARAASVSDTVAIAVAHDEVRVELPIVGGTKWFRWNGTPEDLKTKLCEAAYEFGAEVDWERNEFGSTPWDAPTGP